MKLLYRSIFFEKMIDILEIISSKMNRTYKSLLFDKQIPLLDENEIKERNSVANWLQSNRHLNINKYDNNWGQNISIGDAFHIIKNSVENQLPEQQRADTWDIFIHKIRDINIGRPITKLEDIAIKNIDNNKIQNLSNNNNYSTTVFEVLGNTEKNIDLNLLTTSSKLTQFVYIGSKDETNNQMGIVKTIYNNVRDQEFENKWYMTNDKAKLYCIKNEFNIPISSVDVWTKQSKDILPDKKCFSKFVYGYDTNKSIDKITKYIDIAVNQLDDYLQLDEDDKKFTITRKYIDYMKLYLDVDDDDKAIKELLLLGKKRKRSMMTYDDYISYNDNDDIDDDLILTYKSPEKLDYSMDTDLLEHNRDLWNKQQLFGYKKLCETNNMFAPFGYNEDLTERIAPYGFLKDDPDNRARLSNNGRFK